jgi:hypothetical protein
MAERRTGSTEAILAVYAWVKVRTSLASIICERRTILSEGVSAHAVNLRNRIAWNNGSDLVTVPMLEHILADIG